MSLSRRGFIQGAAALGAYQLLSACGAEHAHTLQSIEQLNEGGINGPATANKQAVRLNPPEPQPVQTWRAGDFVLNANVDFPGVALDYDAGPSTYNT